MADQWIKYINNFDRVLEEAIRTSIKNSLRNIYEALHGDETTDPGPCLKLTILLHHKKVYHIKFPENLKIFNSKYLFR